MVRIFLALLALCASAGVAFAGGGAVAIPPIWSIMLLVIITAIFLAAAVGLSELDTIEKNIRNFLAALLLILWVWTVYYFI